MEKKGGNKSEGEKEELVIKGLKCNFFDNFLGV